MAVSGAAEDAHRESVRSRHWGSAIVSWRQLVGGEAGQVQVEVQLFQSHEFLDQEFIIPSSQLSGFVVGQAISLGLGSRQAGRDVDGDFGKTKF